MIPKYALDSLPEEFAQALREHLGISASSQLASLAEAAAFLRSKQVATLWGGTELPSLHEAVEGDFVPLLALVSSGGMRRVWAWSRKLVESQEFVLVKLFRRRATFVARSLWPALVELAPSDPDAAWRAGGLSTIAREIARFLQEAGPSDTVELEQALSRRFPLLPKSLKKGLREVEEKLIIHPQRLGEHYDRRNSNTWELLQRSLADGKPSLVEGGAPEAVARLLEAVLRAAGVVDARELGHWLPTSKQGCRDVLSGFVAAGKVSAKRKEFPGQLVWCGVTGKIRDAA